MEWTVKELADRAGISGRALRHYHRIGLLQPDRVGSNGYRFYGPQSVARLQRILLLRDTGMPLTDIAVVLDAHETPNAEIEPLHAHLEQLDADRRTLDRRIAAVQHTLTMRREGRQPQMDVMLQGFNDGYEAEVVERWGRDAFEASNEWWHSKSVSEQRAWKVDTETLLAGWRELQEEGHEPDSPTAQIQASEHLNWFAKIPATPTHAGDREKSTAMVLGIADQYESNPDFHVKFAPAQNASSESQPTVLRMLIRDSRQAIKGSEKL